MYLKILHQRKRYYSSAQSNSPNSPLVVPAVTYSNTETQKLEILENNKGESGIYR